MIFIDSNIPMYASTPPAPQKEKCVLLFKRIEEHAVDAASSAEVLQEILHRYRAVERMEEGFRIYEAFRALPIRWLEIIPEDVDEARQFLMDFPRLSSRDALHIAVMRRHRITKIVTYDSGFLGIPSLTVYLPEQLL